MVLRPAPLSRFLERLVGVVVVDSATYVRV